jgi:hypothetical protein
MAVQTITTAGDIPKILNPYYEGRPAEGTPGTAGYKPEIVGLLERGIGAIFPTLEGAAASRAAYETQFAPLYQAGLMGAGTVAPMSEFQEQVGRELAGISLPGQYGLATQAGQAAAGAFQGLPGVGTEDFTLGAAQRYMSPYQQAVVDIQQRQAIDAAKQAQLGQNLAAARQGTYGGARQAILQGARESGLRQQLGDIQAQGLQSAYDRAAQQFQADRQARQAAQQANLTGQLQGASGLAGLAQTMGGLGTQQLAGQLDITKTLGAFGDLQRGITQQQMDAQRQALMDQAQYGQTQVGQLSNLLRGVPLSDTTQTTSTPPPSFASQLTGLGLTGLSLYNLLGNK